MIIFNDFYRYLKLKNMFLYFNTGFLPGNNPDHFTLIKIQNLHPERYRDWFYTQNLEKIKNIFIPEIWKGY